MGLGTILRSRLIWILVPLALGAQSCGIKPKVATLATAVSNQLSTTGAANTITPVSGDAQSGTAGTLLTNNLVAVVNDASSNPVPNITVTWAVTAGGGSTSSCTTTSDASGLVHCSFTTGATAGANTISASAQGVTLPAVFSATGLGAPASITVSSGDAQNGTAGSPLAGNLVAVVKDAGGSVIPNVNGIVWAVASGGGAVSSCTTTTDASGLVSCIFTTNTTAGVSTITATLGVLTAATFTETGVAGAPVSIAISSGDGQGGSISAPLPGNLIVVVKDVNNNLVNGATIDWAVASGGGSLLSASSTSSATGLASNTFTMGSAIGSNTATATIHATTYSVTFNARACAFSVLAAFSQGNLYGMNPYFSTPVLSGSTLFGTTQNGGANSNGSIYSIQTDGSNFTTLYSFQSGISGSSPGSGLILSGTTLYGINQGGTIYSISTSGTNFTVIHQCVSATEGNASYSKLTLVGSTLYGANRAGGINNKGTLFSVDVSGSGFTILHSFSAATTDGSYPWGSLVVSGGTIYGITNQGGANNQGTIYSISTSGSSFTLLRSFSSAADGQYPTGLILSSGLLYGATVSGGSSNFGTIFKMTTAGVFSVLKNLSVYAEIYGDLNISGTTIYGSASHGGTGYGYLFSLATDGTSFTVLHNFSSANTDGSAPFAPPILSGSTLYGVTTTGGTVNSGTVYSIDNSGTGFTLLTSFVNTLATLGANPLSKLVLSASGTILYGMTNGGGANNVGNIFSVNTDGTNLTNLHSFSSATTDGKSPQYGALTLSGTKLYGMTAQGGSNVGSYGTIFSINTDGTGFTLLHSFVAGAADGANPYGGLILAGGKLYGMTGAGGTTGSGTIFTMNTDGSGFVLLRTFTSASDGASPRGDLTISGTTLFGATSSGGTNNKGTIFSMNTDGTGFTVLRNFTSASDGANPYSTLVLSGTVLYGTTTSGGPNIRGTIFSINTDGTGFTVLRSLTSASDGQNPYSSLVLSGSTLYGTTYSGGSTSVGTIFSIDTNGSNFTVFRNMTRATDGGFLMGGLIVSGTTLFGQANLGGTNVGGTVYKLTF